MFAHCNFQESVTAGTVLHRTKLTPVRLYWAAYMLAQDKSSVSAMHVLRELNLSYATAWTMLHKLRRALADKGGDLLGGVVETAETYYVGKGGPGSAGRSLANDNKALIVMAVERKPARKNQVPGIKKSGFVVGRVGSTMVAMIASAASGSIGAFIRESLSPATNMRTDGWSGYFTPGQAFKHEPTVQGNRILPFVNLQFSNLKPWLNGTFYGVSPKHLPAYLQEWNYRFKRRSIISDLFQYIIKSVVNTVAITCSEVAQGMTPIKALHVSCG